MSQCIPCWVYFIWYSFFLDLSEWFLSHVREIFGYYLLEYFFCPLLSLFSFWHPYNTDVGAFHVVPEFSEMLFVFNLFSLFCSASVVSTNLSSTSLICSSASCILLLATSKKSVVFLFFVFVFLPFLGPLPQHMEVPRLGVKSEL